MTTKMKVLITNLTFLSQSTITIFLVGYLFIYLFTGSITCILFCEPYLGVELFSSGFGNRYYESNDLDPYIKDKNVSSFLFFILHHHHHHHLFVSSSHS